MPAPTRRPIGLVIAIAALACAVGRAADDDDDASPRFRLRRGDRIVFVGDGIMEREADRGAIETALVAMHPDLDLTVRNLGWSGDTVWAEARGVFDAPSAGYARLLELVRSLAPTVVVVAYGRNESFAGPEGLEAFRTQLARLCADLRTGGGEAPPRIVLVTPPPFEGVPPLTPAAAAERTARLAGYADAIRAVAAAESAAVVDLFAAVTARLAPGATLTENGIHLSDAGSDAAAAEFAAAAGRPLSGDFAGRTRELRAAVVAKNRLFFHRWRPTNETYLFLFRRHEQGNNAVEIPLFDPLVEAAEGEVRARLRESP